jgi:hypothetical protein
MKKNKIRNKVCKYVQKIFICPYLFIKQWHLRVPFVSKLYVSNALSSQETVFFMKFTDFLHVTLRSVIQIY